MLCSTSRKVFKTWRCFADGPSPEPSTSPTPVVLVSETQEAGGGAGLSVLTVMLIALGTSTSVLVGPILYYCCCRKKKRELTKQVAFQNLTCDRYRKITHVWNIRYCICDGLTYITNNIELHMHFPLAVALTHPSALPHSPIGCPSLSLTGRATTGIRSANSNSNSLLF